jgi:hypothetical protein
VTVFASVADHSYSEAIYELRTMPVPATTYFPRYEANARRVVLSVLSINPDLLLVGTFPFFSPLGHASATMISSAPSLTGAVGRAANETVKSR